MSSPSPTATHAWHALFATAPFPALDGALAAGLVQGPCIAEGRDLLHVLLSRPPTDFGQVDTWWAAASGHGDQSPPRLSKYAIPPKPTNNRVPANDLYPLLPVVRALLAREEVDPLRPAATPVPPQFGVEPQPDFPASALALALAANLTPVVELIIQWARAHGRTDDLDRALSQAAPEAIPAQAARLPVLHACAATNRASLVEVLLETSIDPDARDAAARTPLYHARSPAVAMMLVDAGASIQDTGAELGLHEHWRTQRDRERYPSSTWNEMMEMVARHDPSQAHSSLVPAAVAWFGKIQVPVSEYTRDAVNESRKKWDKGWDQAMVPAQTVCALPDMRGRTASGPMRGQASLLSELGWRWLRDADGPSNIHLGFLDHSLELASDTPMSIRRGLSDWDVFALGAIRHLAYHPHPSARLAPASSAVLEQSHSRARQMLVAMFDCQVDARQRLIVSDALLDAAMRAAAAAARTKSAPAWLGASEAWTHAFHARFPLPTNPLGPPQPDLAHITQGLALARRAAEAGVRWLTPESILPRWWKAAGEGQRLTEQAREDFMIAAVCMLCDRLEMHRMPKNHNYQFNPSGIRGQFGRAFDQIAQDLGPMEHGLSPLVARKAQRGMDLIEDFSTALAARLEAMRLDQALDAAPPAAPAARARM